MCRHAGARTPTMIFVSNPFYDYYMLFVGLRQRKSEETVSKINFDGSPVNRQFTLYDTEDINTLDSPISNEPNEKVSSACFFFVRKLYLPFHFIYLNKFYYVQSHEQQ